MQTVNISAMVSPNENPEPKRWKRGDVGPDGMLFWQYGKSYKNGEQWVAAEKLEEYKAKRRECYAKPEYKAKMREHKAKPEYKAKMREYMAKPEVKAKKREYRAKPEYKAKGRERMAKYSAKPEVKAKQREYNAKSYKEQRNQAAADQFFVMMGACEQLTKIFTENNIQQ